MARAAAAPSSPATSVQPAAPPAPSTQAASPPTASAASLLPASPPSAPTGATPPPPLGAIDGAYQGVIGKDLRVIVRVKSAGEGFTGDYFYEAKGVHLKLRGSLTEPNTVTLDETNAQGKQTGRIEGYQTASGGIEGTWSSPDGARKLPFSLTRMPRDLTANPVIIVKHVLRQMQKAKEPAIGETKPGTCDVDVKYAEVTGVSSAVAAKINAKLAPPPLEPCDSGYETARDYEVTLNRDGVLSIAVEGNSMYAGAAHPSNFEGFMVNFDVTTGDEISLAQVLRAPIEATCRKLFTPTIKELTSAPDTRDFVELLENLFDTPEFVFVPEGMRFTIVHTLPHALQALSAEGFAKSYAELAPMLDGRSAVKRLWAKR